MTLRIANGAGFLGDQLDAPKRLVKSATVDYLTLEYLAELTMSILARLREKDPQLGYARDFLQVLESLIPSLMDQSQLRIVTNAGGVNPFACVRETASRLTNAGLPQCLIGAVTGDNIGAGDDPCGHDDLAGQLARFQEAGWMFANLETGQPLSEAPGEVVSAHAYLGAEPIAEALRSGARVVVAGRVADASLTLGPCLAHFDWVRTDWDRLAGGSIAGHLIECGAQVTGGYSTRWQEIDFDRIGYPIAEIESDGSCVITKPEESGGIVDFLSVAQQMIYEIGDPRHYLTPDVEVDFTSVQLAEVGENRVAVSGGRGHPPPGTLKVSMAYRAGFLSSGQLLVLGANAVSKAQTCATLIRSQLQQAGLEFEHFHVECLGAAEAERTGKADAAAMPAEEVVMRVTVRDANRGAVERFSREFAPLITSGPAGLAGYAAGRPSVVPLFGYWPTTIPRDWVRPKATVKSAQQWLEEGVNEWPRRL